ncbi:hypothetical protein NPIL_189891, partial [Nephila pilipes]
CQVPSQFSEMQYQFENEWLPHLKEHELVDYKRKSSTAQGQITNRTDDRLIYQGLMIPIEVAYKIFSRQQSIKNDMKHLLCSNYLERLHRLTLSERECTDEQDADNKESDCKIAVHYALVEDGSENDNYHALPPTRPNTPVQQTNDNEPTTQNNARRWLPRL